MLQFCKKLYHRGLAKSIAHIGPFCTQRYKMLKTNLRYFYKHIPHASPAQISHLLLQKNCKTLFKSFMLQQHIPNHWKDVKELENELKRISNKEIILFEQSISIDHPDLWIIDPLHRTYLIDPCIASQMPCGPSLSLAIAEKNKADIRIAWELARLQHLSKRATLLTIASQSQKEILARSIKETIFDWYKKNPYLHGPHWYNSMEVGIRAINLLYTYQILLEHFFLSTEEQTFWIQMLFQHTRFIEEHFEKYHLPNNHYLTNLVAYIQLLLFFGTSPKKINSWIHHTTSAFITQLLPDGWAYEGSSAYHRLDTELLLQTYLVALIIESPDKETLHSLYKRAITALQTLKGSTATLPLIGDNDSGTILTGLNLSTLKNNIKIERKKPIIDHFPQMGLTVIQTEQCHITIRHAYFEEQRPTGHYHNDDLSITLSVNNKSVLIDPGTYLYSSNPKERNNFRSWSAHNGPFCIDELDYEEKQPLFSLYKKIWLQQPIILHEANEIIVLSKRPLYCKPGFLLRKLIISDTTLTIKDSIESDYLHDLRAHFILAPEIALHYESEQKWNYSQQESSRGTFSTHNSMSVHDAWIAKNFGKKEETLQIKVQKNALSDITCLIQTCSP